MCQDKEKELEQKVRNSALGSLTRREHSRAELLKKLQQKFPDADCLDSVIQWLEELSYLDDQRFACAFVRTSIAKGRGPIRIKQELRLKGVSNSHQEYALAEEAVDWFELAGELLERKYREPISDQKDKARRIRFLQSRGFDSNTIFSLL